MQGEMNLDILIKTMQPILVAGDYVFCTIAYEVELDLTAVFMYFKEQEGITLVLRQETADQWGLSYSFIAAWISLKVHSSLQAVGLTAAFSNTLAAAGISCNVVAGFYHDHIFVDKKDAQAAMKLLEELANQ
jgi:hypothetical protein